MMAERHDDPPAIFEIEAMRAPARTDAARRKLTERILAAAEPLLTQRREPVSSWDVLAGWARPGLVAASIALFIAAGALLTGRISEPAPAEPVTLDEVLALAEGGEFSALLVSLNEPDAEAFAEAALMEGAPSADALESVNRGEEQ